MCCRGAVDPAVGQLGCYRVTMISIEITFTHNFHSSQCHVENWNWPRWNLFGFSRGLHREAQPSDCPQSAPGGGRTCRRTVWGDLKSFKSSISPETLSVSFMLSPLSTVKFWHVVF